MASKKNLSLDDFGLGDDFSDATMDFSVRESSSKKRSPILGMGKVMAKGAVSGLTDASFIRQSIKKTLPEGYGSAFDFADESAATFKSLYNTSATAMRPLTNDLKRTTQRLMPSAGQIIPEKMRRTLDTWSKDIEGQSKYNPEDAINAQIAQSQNEVFQYEFKQRQSDRAEKAAKEEIKEGIEQSRFQTSAKMLNMISLSTQKLADYQEKVTINYQRKMLELQYRQVYILRDTHEEQKRMGAVITEGLKSLIHNTGLPDYEKLTEKNRAGGFMRNQFSSFMGQGLSSARTAFMGKLRGAAEARIKSKVGDFANSAQNALMMANVMLDAKEQMDGMKESMGDMGEDDFGVKGVAAGMGSGWLAQKGAGKGLDCLKKYLAKNPNVTPAWVKAGTHCSTSCWVLVRIPSMMRSRMARPTYIAATTVTCKVRLSTPTRPTSRSRKSSRATWLVSCAKLPCSVPVTIRLRRWSTTIRRIVLTPSVIRRSRR
jgi:hypothetical protein